MTLSLDGYAINHNSDTPSVTATITTSNSNDVIIAIVWTANSWGSPTISGGGLTWTLRKDFSGLVGSGFGDAREYYAIASSPLASQTITFSHSNNAYDGILVFGVSGANTTSPFDSNSGLPAVAPDNATGTATSVSINTSNTGSDFVFGVIMDHHTATAFTVGTGYTLIVSQPGTSPCGAGEYQIVSGAQTNLTVNFTDTGGTMPAIIADALVAASVNVSGTEQISETATTIFSQKTTGAEQISETGAISTAAQLAGTESISETQAVTFSQFLRGEATLAELASSVFSQKARGTEGLSELEALVFSQKARGTEGLSELEALVFSQKLSVLQSIAELGSIHVSSGQIGVIISSIAQLEGALTLNQLEGTMTLEQEEI
jgi:hypothetical protein